MQAFERIIQFDFSKKHAALILLAMLAGYSSFAAWEIFEPDCDPSLECFDYGRREARLAIWDINWVLDDFRHFGHFGILVLSRELFGNPKVLVFASSLLLLIILYLLTYRITEKHVAGLVAVAFMFSSHIFLGHDVSITYPTLWTTAFMGSIYIMISKHSTFSVPLYLSSIPMKILNGLFFPGLILFMWFSDIDKQKKKKLLIIYLSIAVVGAAVIFTLKAEINDSLGLLVVDRFDGLRFVEGLGSWANAYRSDASSLVSLFAVMFGLMMLRKKNVKYATSLLSIMIMIIATSPVIWSTTSYDPSWPYRWLPLVSFTAVGMGVIFANLKHIDFSLMKASLNEPVVKKK